MNLCRIAQAVFDRIAAEFLEDIVVHGLGGKSGVGRTWIAMLPGVEPEAHPGFGPFFAQDIGLIRLGKVQNWVLNCFFVIFPGPCFMGGGKIRTYRLLHAVA